MSQDSQPTAAQPSVLVDGYVSQCFSPKPAEGYFFCLLKGNSIPPNPPWHAPGIEGPFFFVPSVPRHISDQFSGQSRWVLDRGILNKGTVVPQQLWTPHTLTDKKHHVEQAELQLPIFFQCTDGRLGLSLEAAATGRCHSLTNAQSLAPLGEKSSTHIRILWPGYVEFKRQVQTRDETTLHKPITLYRFAFHIGRTVDVFIKNCKRDAGCPTPKWHIGETGIKPSDIVIIGAVHVSAGTWMPILQLNRFII